MSSKLCNFFRSLFIAHSIQSQLAAESDVLSHYQTTAALTKAEIQWDDEKFKTKQEQEGGKSAFNTKLIIGVADAMIFLCSIFTFSSSPAHLSFCTRSACGYCGVPTARPLSNGKGTDILSQRVSSQAQFNIVQTQASVWIRFPTHFDYPKQLCKLLRYQYSNMM